MKKDYWLLLPTFLNFTCSYMWCFAFFFSLSVFPFLLLPPPIAACCLLSGHRSVFRVSLDTITPAVRIKRERIHLPPHHYSFFSIHLHPFPFLYYPKYNYSLACIAQTAWRCETKMKQQKWRRGRSRGNVARKISLHCSLLSSLHGPSSSSVCVLYLCARLIPQRSLSIFILFSFSFDPLQSSRVSITKFSLARENRTERWPQIAWIKKK